MIHHRSAPDYHSTLPPTHGRVSGSIGERRKAFGTVQGFPEVRGPWIKPIPGAITSVILAVIIFLLTSAPK